MFKLNYRSGKVAQLVLLSGFCLSLGSGFAEAREHERWHGDIRSFHVHDYPLWQRGHWYHGPHGGHGGWWWIVGSTWYMFAQPAYPYPNPYVPPTVIVNQQVSPAPVQVAAPPPSAPPVGVPAQVWYHCKSPEGYYPYVASCPEGWNEVAATAPADLVSGQPPSQ